MDGDRKTLNSYIKTFNALKKIGLYNAELPKISYTLKNFGGENYIYYSTKAIDGTSLESALSSDEIKSENSKKLGENLLKTAAVSLFLDLKDVRPANIMIHKDNVNLTIIDPLFHEESSERPNFTTINPDSIDTALMAENPIECLFDSFRKNSTSYINYIWHDRNYIDLIDEQRSKGNILPSKNFFDGNYTFKDPVDYMAENSHLYEKMFEIIKDYTNGKTNVEILGIFQDMITETRAALQSEIETDKNEKSLKERKMELERLEAFGKKLEEARNLAVKKSNTVENDEYCTTVDPVSFIPKDKYKSKLDNKQSLNEIAKNYLLTSFESEQETENFIKAMNDEQIIRFNTAKSKIALKCILRITQNENEVRNNRRVR